MFEAEIRERMIADKKEREIKEKGELRLCRLDLVFGFGLVAAVWADVLLPLLLLGLPLPRTPERAPRSSTPRPSRAESIWNARWSRSAALPRRHFRNFHDVCEDEINHAHHHRAVEADARAVIVEQRRVNAEARVDNAEACITIELVAARAAEKVAARAETIADAARTRADDARADMAAAIDRATSAREAETAAIQRECVANTRAEATQKSLTRADGRIEEMEKRLDSVNADLLRVTADAAVFKERADTLVAAAKARASEEEGAAAVATAAVEEQAGTAPIVT